MKQTFLAVWVYRYFILSSIKTEFISRFARSKLGGIWMILHPLAQVLVYALVLSQIMRAKLPGVESQYAYSIYILAGMVAWTLFSDILNRFLTIFIDNGNLLKKVSFPKLALPLISIGSAFVNFILLLFVMFVVFALLGHLPYHALLWLPVLIFLALTLATGIGLFLGTLNVFMRDIGQFMQVAINFWFWLTPIVYMISIVPEKYHWLIMLNPMTAIVIGYQNILVYDKAPDLNILVYPTVLSIIMLLLSLVAFKRANEEMVDLL